MTKLIPVTLQAEQLEAGMITSEQVKDRSGRLLVGPEVTLTDKHLKVFKTWGVTAVDVVVDEDTLSDLGISANKTDDLVEVDLIDATNYSESLFELSNFKTNETLYDLHLLIVQRVAQGKQKMR